MRRVPKLSFAQGQLMLWILAGSLVAFGAMILFIRFSGVSLVTTNREVPQVYFRPTPRQDPLSVPVPADVVAEVFDPSLMSLPSVHGFSERLWARKIDAKQRDLGWDQPAAFLGVTIPGMPAPLLQPVPVDQAVVTAAEKIPALSEEASDSEALAPPMSVNQSVVRILGPLGDRSVTFTPPLPTVNSAVPPTQVRVGVDAGGLVLYTMLERSSGDDSVDGRALDLAKQFRFESARDGNASTMTWGVLRFLWAAQSASATNVENVVAQH
ncbi:MAG TPA: hypothetical protein VMV72_20225 [Verrucomicrobiae bacterium]|nr:hypothetical protein [Verrucomicrobiae bacterium]